MNEDATASIGHLIETIDNGRLGLAEAATRLAKRDHEEMATTFSQLSAERKDFADQLRNLTDDNGDTDAADADGTTPGLLHRGFITLTDAVTGDSPTLVLKNVVSGEAYAMSVYEQVLEVDLPPDLRAAIELQLVSVKASHKLAEALLSQSSVKRS